MGLCISGRGYTYLGEAGMAYKHNRSVISTVLNSGGKKGYSDTEVFGGLSEKTKENSISDYVIADSKGEPLAASQSKRWQYALSAPLSPGTI